MDRKMLAEVLIDMDDIMKTHGLTEREAVSILRAYCGMTHTLSITERLALLNKSLIVLDDTGNDTVNDALLFKDKATIQTILTMEFESVPKSEITHLELAHKLEKELVPEDIDKDEMITAYANKYFSGDKTVARYFVIFRFIFPDKSGPGAQNWTRHFKVGFDGVKRWVPTSSNAKKFHDIYRKRDIGIFLAGAYYAVQDSVDINSGTCFMVTSDKFMIRYDALYDFALDKLKAAGKKAAQRKEIMKNNDVIDTIS